MTPTELIDQLNSAEGEIYIADPSERVRAQYRRAIHGAKERGLVPEGFQLWGCQWPCESPHLWP